MKLPISLFQRVALVFLWTGLVLCFQATTSIAQVNNRDQTASPSTATTQDSTFKKTNTADWNDERVKVYFKRLDKVEKYYPDTSLFGFHQSPGAKNFYRDLGNLGSASQSLIFRPTQDVGPQLGYTIYDVYGYHQDSLFYYNTTNPYSVFKYRLGSKLEQIAELMHTQNITPLWNVAAAYRKLNSPGTFLIQRINSDYGMATTQYQSRKLHYQLSAGFIYNYSQQDENGGIIADSFLQKREYNDRKTVPVRFENDLFSSRRSAVENQFRQTAVQLNHGYTFGKLDTTYNKDSSLYFSNITPRFKITHKAVWASEKHQFKDALPDSFRYAPWLNYAFLPTDSLLSRAAWWYLDNSLQLSGFIGKYGHQLSLNAGLGVRYDQFQFGDTLWRQKDAFVSNYLFGSIEKPAEKDFQWAYGAYAKLYYAGRSAGDFKLGLHLSKSFKTIASSFSVGVDQQLRSQPLSHANYYNTYYVWHQDIASKESQTALWLKLSSEKYRLFFGTEHYLLANYFYWDQNLSPLQFKEPFTVSRIWLKKDFHYHVFFAQVEGVYQQKTNKAPINIPSFMGSARIGIEQYLFRRALKLNTGLEGTYFSPFKAADYSPFLNRFVYQDGMIQNNAPEMGAFLNFKIKRFRAGVSLAYLQQLYAAPFINYTGYPMQKVTLRFGFSWELLN